MTTPELHYLLGARLAEIEKALGVKEPSLLSTAYKYGVPIFVGAVQDGSIFLNIVKLKRLLGESFRLEIDVNDDVFEMGAMQHHCFATLKKPMAVWILGGGVPKNYTLQGEPLLDQILGVPDARLRHRRAALRRSGRQRRAELVPGRRGPHLGQGQRRER